MTPPDSNDDHLADLRRRWEEDPGSRIFLQLAEEYRRAGRNEEALEVLEKGMEAHPKQVSGLVSLGRIHLALEQPADAAEALEKAVEIDPTNPMAMKLATEAHLQAGDRAMAKQRLDLYKLLNAGDEDTESLEARVEGREPASGPEEAGQPSTDPGDDASHGEAAGDGDAAPAGSWSPTAAWPELPKGEPRGDTSAADVGSPPVEPSEAADAVAGGYASEFGERDDTDQDVNLAADDRPEPFADLLSDTGEGDYLSGLAAEGIFPVEEDDLREAASQGEPAAAQESAAEPTQESVPVATDDDPFPELAAPSEVESGDSPWDLVDEGKAVHEDEAAAESPEGLVDEEDALVVRDEALPVAAPEDALAETPDSGPRPTVTLGQLYLDQGHHAEALAIFDAVLEREPGHQAAAAGRRAALAQQEAEAEPEAAGTGQAAQPVTAPTGFSLEAGDLLRGADPSKPRKVALLEAYLDRIRGERAS